MLIAKLLPSRIFSAQARKPSGFIGRYLMTRVFNSGNADLNAFVMELLDLQGNDRVLEVGFGPGTLIHAMATITTQGVVEGIDFSAAMLKQAGKVNRQHIANGRVLLHEGESGALPMNDQSFEKLCSVNTLYFMKEPEKDFGEMFRVMKRGGKVVIGFRDDKQMRNLNLSKEIFTTYSRDEVVAFLAGAGFSDPQVKQKEGVPFLSYCAVATKA